MSDPDKELAEWMERAASERAQSLKEGLKILETGLQMDILRRNTQSAASRVLRMADLRHADSEEERRVAISRAHKEWHDEGKRKNLPFYVEVAEKIVSQGLREANSK